MYYLPPPQRTIRITHPGPVSRKSWNLSGDIILFVSSRRSRLAARNFVVILIFIPFTTYEKTSFTELAGRSFMNGFSGPESFRNFRGTGPWSVNLCWNVRVHLPTTPPKKNPTSPYPYPYPQRKKIILYTNTSPRNSCQDIPKSNGYNFPTPTPHKNTIPLPTPREIVACQRTLTPPLRIMTPLPTPKEKKKHIHWSVLPGILTT